MIRNMLRKVREFYSYSNVKARSQADAQATERMQDAIQMSEFGL